LGAMAASWLAASDKTALGELGEEGQESLLGITILMLRTGWESRFEDANRRPRLKTGRKSFSCIWRHCHWLGTPEQRQGGCDSDICSRADERGIRSEIPQFYQPMPHQQVQYSLRNVANTTALKSQKPPVRRRRRTRGFRRVLSFKLRVPSASWMPESGTRKAKIPS
jgi:hypothetical protein